ncbi:MAG: PAS domain S-box protein [Rhodothermaceae bacterium]
MNSKIHIIEDERIVALDLKFKLQKLGYEIIGMSASGEEALEKIKNEKPDLVLMDIMLQGEMDGIHTANIIKEKYKIPFIYLSALSDEVTINRVKITEPYGYILKPFDIGDLKTNIEIALHKASIEKQLVESELKYRTLFATARDAVVTLDENGIITSLNVKALEMFNYKEKEILEQSIKVLIPDIFVNHFSEGIKKFINLGKPLVGDIIEITARRKNGERFDIELSFSRWESDVDYQYTLIIREITERKRQEAELKASRDNLEKRVEERTVEIRSLIDQSTLPICVFNKDGVIQEYNDEFLKIKEFVFNFNSKEGNQFLIEDLVKNCDCTKSLKLMFETGEGFITKPIFYETNVEDPSDEGSIFIIHFYAIKNEKNFVLKGVCVLEDITESIKAEEARQKLGWQKQHNKILLEKLEEERLRISRELHDEIGPMLFSSKLYLEAYKKENLVNSKYITDSTRLLYNAGVELKNIIRSLQPSVLNNYGLVSAIKLLLKDMQEKSGIDTEFNYGDEALKFESLQAELNVYRIVQEALNNIRKHAKATKVNMDLFCNSEFLSLCIKDNGRGFKNEDIQVDDEYISFGLKNMRERTELLSGNFSIESEVDKGTTIFIDFPGEMIDAKN